MHYAPPPHMHTYMRRLPRLVLTCSGLCDVHAGVVSYLCHCTVWVEQVSANIFAGVCGILIFALGVLNE